MQLYDFFGHYKNLKQIQGFGVAIVSLDLLLLCVGSGHETILITDNPSDSRE